MNLLGTPPIARLPYVLGKLSLLACVAALVARWWWPAIVRFRHPVLDGLGAVVLAVGLLVAVVGGMELGASTRVGLPEEQTALKTGGLYHYTRNPMYVGAYLACLAAILWTANLIVVALALIVVLVHHQVILAEERYLTATFGDAYSDYTTRVPRYL